MSDPDETADQPNGGASGDLAAGVEQFQKAALEALRAARAMLDAAETIVADPRAIDSVISSVAGLARDATQAVAGFAAGTARAANGVTRDQGDQSDDGFESIDVD